MRDHMKSAHKGKALTLAFACLSIFLSISDPMYAGQSAFMKGTETGLDIPRFVSIRPDRVNVRRGPTTDHQIDWVFEQKGLPVAVTAEFGHWRRIEDAYGDGGWVHRAMIAGKRQGVVLEDEVEVFMAPIATAGRVAVAKKHTIFSIQECNDSWCRVSTGQTEGWVQSSALWGADPSVLLK